MRAAALLDPDVVAHALLRGGGAVVAAELADHGAVLSRGAAHAERGEEGCRADGDEKTFHSALLRFPAGAALDAPDVMEARACRLSSV
ncbi:MAG: hypothetical protein BroJett013_01050 [Alphaproteobacteria bacterium]|nr:MAG: hypothetical protein BroJett013_01050 [Alphaproteobacteria bacterium]